MNDSVLSLFPLGTTVDDGGQLLIAGQRASELAAQFGTPLYVYHVETIRHQIETYRRSLSRYGGQARLTYASKAFQCTALARLMTEQQVGLDVASAGEIFIAMRGGANPAQMHMHGNNKSRLDLESALEAGVGRIVVDNATELATLAEMAAERNQQVKIWLRVTPNVAVDTVHAYTVTGKADSKFGLPVDEAARIAEKLLAEDSPLELTGLHVHLGSHFHDAEPVAQAVEKLLDLAAGLNWSLPELCAGGGWGVRYHPDDPPMPIEPFVDDLVAAVELCCQRRGLPLPELILEPGRSIVAQAGVALYTIGHRKVIPGVRTFVNIDGGLADNPRPAIYQARYSGLLANRAAEPAAETVAIAGPFCETGDILIQQIALPVAETDDILAVPVAGAYQLAMGSNYNAALKPAVIFIDGAKTILIQRRETFEDLVRRDAG